MRARTGCTEAPSLCYAYRLGNIGKQLSLDVAARWRGEVGLLTEERQSCLPFIRPPIRTGCRPPCKIGIAGSSSIRHRQFAFRAIRIGGVIIPDYGVNRGRRNAVAGGLMPRGIVDIGGGCC